MNPPRKYTFMPSSAEGVAKKRKQVRHACKACRRQKKRCTHVLKSPSTGSKRAASWISGDSPVPASHEDDTNEINEGCNDDGTLNKPHHDSKRTRSHGTTSESRYVGHLNPEAAFLEDSQDGETTSNTQKNSVGVWQSDRGLDEDVSQLRRSQYSLPRYQGIYAPTDDIKALLPRIEMRCTALLPPLLHRAELEAIYFKEIDPMLPVIEREDYAKLSLGSEDHQLLCQAICLAASASPRARKSFYLDTVSNKQLSHAEFVGRLSQALLTQLNVGTVSSGHRVVQLTTILAFCTYFCGSPSLAAGLCARATTSMHTLGLHMPGNGRNESSNETLFFCVWALDRMNAAFLGRPLMIHERDVGRNIPPGIDRQSPGFQLLLRVLLEFDAVIDLYRPTSIKTDECRIRTFESLLQECGRSSELSNGLLSTVEILYHAISMLSCRDRHPLRASTSIWRQHSAMRVRSAFESSSLSSLSWVPWLPYSVLLSLRISYWSFSTSGEPFIVARARKDMLTCYEILAGLGAAFGSVIPIANLASAAVRLFERNVSKKIDAGEYQSSTLVSERDVDPAHAQKADPHRGTYTCPDDDEQVHEFEDPTTFDSSMLDDLAYIDIRSIQYDMDWDCLDVLFGERTDFDLEGLPSHGLLPFTEQAEQH